MKIKNIELWKIADIAKYYKLSPATIKNSVLNKNDFPAPIILPSSKNGLGGKRWVADEIVEYTLGRKIDKK